MIDQLQGPELLLDVHRCKRNIQKMVAKASQLSLKLRPHCKTHQSHLVGQWMQAAGVSSIAVSSLRMAEFFAEGGWRDITIAFPLNVRQISRINDLAAQIQLNLTLEDEQHVARLDAELTQPVSAYLKVDCGTGRTGIRAHDIYRLKEMAKRIQGLELVELKGLLAHAGHTYRALGEAEIAAAHRKCMQLLQRALDGLQDAGFPLSLSYGDTPSCSTQLDFGSVQELRPGNFVFYDLTQTQIGSCSLQDIALAMAAPVVARHPDRQEVILHCGATHLAKDALQLTDGRTSFGQICPLSNTGWDPAVNWGYLRSVSQEHGIAKMTDEGWSKVTVGDLVAVLPVHACHAAHTMNQYRTLEGELIPMLPPAGVRI